MTDNAASSIASRQAVFQAISAPYPGICAETIIAACPQYTHIYVRQTMLDLVKLGSVARVKRKGGGRFRYYYWRIAAAHVETERSVMQAKTRACLGCQKEFHPLPDQRAVGVRGAT